VIAVVGTSRIQSFTGLVSRNASFMAKAGLPLAVGASTAIISVALINKDRLT
jgi:hypothetical protein